MIDNCSLLAILIGVSILAVTFLVASGGPVNDYGPQGYDVPTPLRWDVLAVSAIIIYALIFISLYYFGHFGAKKGRWVYVSR